MLARAPLHAELAPPLLTLLNQSKVDTRRPSLSRSAQWVDGELCSYQQRLLPGANRKTHAGPKPRITELYSAKRAGDVAKSQVFSWWRASRGKWHVPGTEACTCQRTRADTSACADSECD